MLRRFYRDIALGDFGYGIGLTRALILLHYVVDGRRWIRGSERLSLEIFRDLSSPLTIRVPLDFGGSFSLHQLYMQSADIVAEI